jgi:preprotein translocase subunit SecG
MLQVLKIIQVVLAILLVVAILSQQRGSGLGLAFGGEGNFYRSRRGIEKVLYLATIVIAILFALCALAAVYFSGTVN